MATVIGRSDSAERALLRRALDDRGFADGADRYGVQLVDDLPPVPHEWAEPDERVLVVSCGRRRDDGVWGLLARGVEDVISWTGEETVGIVLARLERWREVDRLLSSRLVAPLVQGRSSAMRRLLVDLVEQAAYGSGPILLVGETGTGKELAARAGPRASAARRGAARRRRLHDDRRRRCRAASCSVTRRARSPAPIAPARARSTQRDGGTLFLDEIGELPLDAAGRAAARARRSGTFKRVGGDTLVARSTFRLVARPTATSRAEQRAGRFRSDLYHRIAVGRRARCRRCASAPRTSRRCSSTSSPSAAGRAGARRRRASSRCCATATSPGNVRELRQLAYAVAARHAGPGAVSPGDVPPRYRPDDQAPPPVASSRRLLDRAVRAALAEGLTLAELKTLVGDVAVDAALEESDGSARRAAAMLGVTDRAVQLRRKAPRPRPPSSSES